jgi:hypothetical protein
MQTTTSWTLHLVFSATVVACAAESEDDPTEAADATAPSTTTDDDTSPSTTPSDDDGDDDDTTGAGDDDTGPQGDASAGDDDTSDDSGDPSTTADPADELPPTQGAALETWLAEGRYTAWAAESGVHPSAGPHGGGVRTFVNASLFASLDAGASEHDVGAAVVKELFSGDAIDGWAVMVKVEAGNGGDGWYWYEIIGNSVVADGTGVGLCTGCHGGGTDFVLTPYPLQ